MSTAAATICSKCHAPLTDDHVCRRRTSSGTERVDLFLGGVLGGSIGILLFGMTSSLLIGQGFDGAGMVVGSLSGLALVRTSRRHPLQ